MSIPTKCNACGAPLLLENLFCEDGRELVEAELALGQACRDLQQAHDEICKLQGVAPEQLKIHNWPEWSPQANTIRWAERLLGKSFSRADL